MDKCTKIVIGYILAIVLCTVLILSIRVKLSKNVRVQLSKNVREDFSSEGFYLFFGAIPIIIIGIVLLVALLAGLLEGLFFLGSKLPSGCTDCYKDWTDSGKRPVFL
ncbi:MAG: hypothetical protein Ct9H90mP28_4510 [Paracoccaceae bacterium]|nr:MAG: hypothetical protein Ct9H90mP28_4510 [Paracoccaceae bacterium]|tara:strand:- start:29 stop:349 length:321 start_codon:yes stop_codon:yes gene_type:complete